jgi:acetoin utilization deacetylase AcuC-like enzyme
MYITVMELKIFSTKMKKFYTFQHINIPIIQDLVLSKKKGNTIIFSTFPLEAGTTSEKYLTTYEHVLSKIVEFKPEFLLFSAGFDAHKDDPLAQLKLNSNDFYTLTKRTLEASKKFCNGKVVSILEGGYDLNALMSSTEKHVDALLEFN